MSLEDYNPNSQDSMFTRLVSHLDMIESNSLERDTKMLTALNEIQLQVKLTNGRVTVLEQ